MQILKSVSLTLACFLVLIDCAVKRKDPCDVIDDCTKPLNNFLIEEGELTTYFSLSNGTRLNQFCETSHNVMECLQQYKSDCHATAVSSMVHNLENGNSYICSPEGRADVLALSQSQCVNDKSKQSEVTNGRKSCSEQFNVRMVASEQQSIMEKIKADPVSVCPLLDNLINCVIRVAGDKCGLVYCRFIRNLHNATDGPILMSSGCKTSFLGKCVNDVV